MKWEDQDGDPTLLTAEMERVFNEEFVVNLTGSPPIVRLESEEFYGVAFITLTKLVSCRNAQAWPTVY
jgi:hypothetical protein